MLLYIPHFPVLHFLLFLCPFGLFLYIGSILFAYISKHLPIEHKPSGNAPQAPGAHNPQQATPYANNAPQQPPTPVESTSDKSLATIARLALAILFVFYVCFSFFLCCLLISWIF